MSQSNILKAEIESFFTNSRHKRKYSWEKGEFLAREGAELNSLHYLITGKFRIFRTLNNGREMLYRIYLPGSIIGDIEVFTGSMAASCSVQCIEKADSLALPMSAIRDTPAESAELLFALGRGIARKLHENSVSEALNTLYPLEIRLAHYFLSFDDPLLQAQNLGQLAGWMGCSYRHLTRSLASLRKKGAVKHSKSRTSDGIGYEAADIDMLESIAQPLLMEERGRVLFEPGD